MVVVAPPIFQRQTGLHQRREQGLVEKLVAQTAVEAFDEGVLHWLAWCDVVPADLGLVGPTENGIAGQLRAVVADDSLGPAAGADQKIKLPRDPLAGQRGIRHCSQTLARAVVENRQNAKAPATGQLIGNEVERPAVIGLQRDGDRRPRSQGSFCGPRACVPSAVLPDRCETAACD